MRQRDERRDEDDDDRRDRKEERVAWPREEHGEDRDDHDEDHGHDQETHERTVKMLLVVIAAHCPFHAGLRRSMNAVTPSRKSALV